MGFSTCFILEDVLVFACSDVFPPSFEGFYVDVLRKACTMSMS